MSRRKRAIRPHTPAMSRKEQELDELTCGRLPREELRKAAEHAEFIDGELCLRAPAVRILIDYSPLDPVTKALRHAQFDAALSKKEDQS